MGYEIPLFICALLIPLIMIVAGALMYKCPPKNINSVIGYRTPMSKKNQDTWDFAHRMCGRLWLTAGSVLLVISAAVTVFFMKTAAEKFETAALVTQAVEVTVLLCSVIPVEKALKRNFDENGTRRKQ